MRILLFVVAFLVALAASAPLERWILPLVEKPLAAAGVELHVDGLRLALPAGIRATGINLDTRDGGADVDSLYVGIGRTFDAEACGGRVSGSFSRDSLDVKLDAVNPSRCVRIGKLSLETTLTGYVSVDGVDFLDPRPSPDLGGAIDLRASSGVFRGILENAGRGGEDLPLGEWEFTDLKGGLRVDFRARAAADSPRAKALLGLMPKAAEDKAGWRNYRVVGTLSAPRVVGVE